MNIIHPPLDLEARRNWYKSLGVFQDGLNPTLQRRFESLCRVHFKNCSFANIRHNRSAVSFTVRHNTGRYNVDVLANLSQRRPEVYALGDPWFRQLLDNDPDPADDDNRTLRARLEHPEVFEDFEILCGHLINAGLINTTFHLEGQIANSHLLQFCIDGRPSHARFEKRHEFLVNGRFVPADEFVAHLHDTGFCSNLRIDPPLYEKISKLASAHNLPPQTLISNILEQSFPLEESDSPQTPSAPTATNTPDVKTTETNPEPRTAQPKKRGLFRLPTFGKQISKSSGSQGAT